MLDNRDEFQDCYDAVQTTGDLHAEIPQLVGRIYDAAPAAERSRMLEHLLRPLGALAVVGVCNGIFTRIWFRNGWSHLRIRPEDTQGIDVSALVDYVQQVNAGTIRGLVSMLTASPMIVCSAATAVLVSVLTPRHLPQAHCTGEAGAAKFANRLANDVSQ